MTVHALVPAAELTSYATDVRSMTHGRGRFRATFDRYEAVNPPRPDAEPGRTSKHRESPHPGGRR